jgi:small-conductance mechanosensitive channel
MKKEHKALLVFFILIAIGLVAWWWFGYKQLNDSNFANVWVEAIESGNSSDFNDLIEDRGWTMEDVAAYTVELLNDEGRLNELVNTIRSKSPNAANEFTAGYIPAFIQAAYGYGY